MKKPTFVAIALAFLILNTAYSQVSKTPPYRGADYETIEGEGLNRHGKVVRYPDYKYPDDVLSEWRKNRGFVSPGSVKGILSNPFRKDGTSLNYGLGIPGDFTGHVPIFTEGNNWPFVGPDQGAPLSYGNLETDAGLYFQNGKLVETREPLVVKGMERVTIVNKTEYSYLVSAGNFPGNEQPGQVMTVVSPNGKTQLPIPPKDWWTIANQNTGEPMNAVPEVYASVAGLNPLDAIGWKHSSWSPTYAGGEQPKDYGTPGFAYTFGSLFGRNDGTYDLSNVLFAGFHTNEGYDPLVSGDPMYGCAFYANGKLEAVVDIKLTGTHTAEAVMVAHNDNHPNAAQGGLILSSVIGVQPGETAELHFISHEEAQKLIRTYSSNGNWKKVTKTYQSNTSAIVEDLALPPVIPGEGNTTPTCNDGVQNGDETGVDCGGSCPACITGPTCNDGIQNGNETGIDCGGSCPECTSTDYIQGKFAPSSGRLLLIGQDVESAKNYNTAFDTTPAGHSGYSSVNNLEGLTSTASYGTGPHNTSELASTYPNSTIAIGLYLVDQLNGINNGTYDENISTLIDHLVALDRPVYLRFGYEFDNPGNRYDPDAFKSAWIKFHEQIIAKKAQGHIAMVWQSMCHCSENNNAHSFESYYPGDKYVDLIGLSAFTPMDCNYSGVDRLVKFARNHKKPAMVCESTPQGYDLSDSTVAPVFGDNRGVKSPTTADNIWNEWYKPFFEYIEENEDVIRAVTYINANWDEQGMWDSPYENGYWGDSRVESNTTIKAKWLNEISKPDWVMASPNLFKSIGYKTAPPSPTCTDGIQNGDETGVDCGGSCPACSISPTCDDGIQNGDETGIDCGGSCKTCPDVNNHCGDFGISYIDDATARVYHIDKQWTDPVNIYACIDGNCYAPTKQYGYYYFDFSNKNTWGYVTMETGKTYPVEFKLNHSDGYYTTGEQQFTFTKESCSLSNSKSPLSEHSSTKRLVIYPNPVNSVLYFENNKISDEYEIFTVQGLKVLDGTGNKINVSMLNQGVYMLKSGDKMKIFIKQ